MQYASTRGVGLGPALAPPPTGNISLDQTMRVVTDNRNRWRGLCGVVAKPGDDLRAVISACAPGDTVTLLPGEYDAQATVVIDKRLRLVGFGAVVKGAGVLMQLSAADAEVHGVQFYRTDRVAAQGAVLLTGESSLVQDCTIRSASPNGVRVTGNYCSVQGCKFLQDSSHVAGDSDVYWANGATFGVCCGTMWSRFVGSFSLDYRALDLMSEAANGDASMINVR